MDIDTGGAAAPVADTSASSDVAVSTPNAITNSGGPDNVADTPAAKASKPVSIDDAIERATAKVEKGEGETPKPVKSEQPRDNGKFASKDPAKDAVKTDPKDAPPKAAAAEKGTPESKPDTPAKPAAAETKTAADPASKPSTPPARFSNDAKAVWDSAPEPVKAEVARMEREMTAGIEKHRMKAERDDTIAEFHEMAAKHGTDVKTALTKYTNMETLLRQNPLKGLEAICENIGVSIKDVAAIVMGQTPDQNASRSDATIRELKQQVASLTEQLGGVTQRFQEQDQGTLHKQIADWAADKPLFELLAPHIANEMRDGAKDLDTAYETVLQKHPQLAAMSKAQVANPDTPSGKTSAEASAAEAADLEAQTLKGSKSIRGAQGQGSNPAAKKRSSSIDEAIDAAFAAAG